MAKLKVEFDGFEQVTAKLKKLDGDIKKVTEQALQETHKIVTDKADIAISPHRRTGKTEDSLRRTAQIEWQGTTAVVYVGFDIKSGGLPSIFLMYGTPRHGPVGKGKNAKGGHPGTEADKKLYNAFYGAATRKEILAAQEEIFWDEIRRLEG